ncbi:MAG: Uma2 family endonuclease [Polyangiaceae bacterium]|nr:Uma2 family endonuclease [Polyangiaceae bacterium]
MGLPARALPTFESLYEQIRALPDGITGEILEPGTLRTMSRPGKAHRWTAQAALRRLGHFDVRNGGTGWWIEVEAEILFPRGRLAVPDLSGFRVEHVPELPDENPIAIVPDWCCEILSPTTARDDRRLKLPLYAATGVPWVWLVDPELRLVEVFETVDGRPALTATGSSEECVRLPPFDGEIELASWWVHAR